jgi:geranylgeranyl diphosphate synthase, type I
VAAWSRAEPEVREELERLHALPKELKDEVALARVRALVEGAGGRSATERLAERGAHGALRALTALPNPHGLRELLRSLVERMVEPRALAGGAP